MTSSLVLAALALACWGVAFIAVREIGRRTGNPIRAWVFAGCRLPRWLRNHLVGLRLAAEFVWLAAVRV